MERKGFRMVRVGRALRGLVLLLQQGAVSRLFPAHAVYFNPTTTAAVVMA